MARKPRTVQPLYDRLFGKVDSSDPDACWIWTGRLDRYGYGKINMRLGTTSTAHRMAYFMVKGDIPDGLQLDHLCRNRACVNPDHLEPVTNRVNVLRGSGATAINAAKTHCKRGHVLSGENLYVRRGGRECRECARAAKRAWAQQRASS
jgi:hypothetical protein